MQLERKKLAIFTSRSWNTFKSLHDCCDIEILWAGFVVGIQIII